MTDLGRRGAELWAYLDDHDGSAPEMPLRMAAECHRLAQKSGLRSCGVVRTTTVADRLLSLGRCSGVDTIYVLSDALYCPEPPAVAELASQLCQAVALRRPQMILFPATMLEADIGARVAARLGCAFLCRSVDLEWQEGRPIARRSVFNGRAHQVLCPVEEPPWVATVAPHILNKTSVPERNSPDVELLYITTVESAERGPPTVWRVTAQELDLADADIVLSVGRGVKTAEILKQVHELAELLGAAVGGSREAVFGGLVARDRQVGASGKWIAPRVYVALGISGSTYHMMGVRQARHLVAVNIDPRAPIFESAEIGVVNDVTRIVPALLAALNSKAETASDISNVA